jgi:restriction endonuclease S subunit
MASLNTQILKGVLVALPPLPEQTAIAAILSDMDAEIARGNPGSPKPQYQTRHEAGLADG